MIYWLLARVVGQIGVGDRVGLPPPAATRYNTIFISPPPQSIVHVHVRPWSMDGHGVDWRPAVIISLLRHAGRARQKNRSQILDPGSC